MSFYGRRPVEEMPEFYKEADAFLITLDRDPILSRTLPGKMQTYMASGRPIIGAADGEISAVIRDSGCGFCGPAGDGQTLANNIRRFMKTDFSERIELGERAIAFYRKSFDRHGFFEQLEAELFRLAEIGR